MSEQLSEGQRVIRRALALMQNKGYGWSKAIAKAAESVEQQPTTTTKRGGR